MIPAMSHKEFTSAKALLPALLARLSKESGKATHLQPVWAEVVGEVTARNTRPVMLDGSVLHLEVQSPRWRAAIQDQEQEILARLNEKLGRSAQVSRLVFHSVEPK